MKKILEKHVLTQDALKTVIEYDAQKGTIKRISGRDIYITKDGEQAGWVNNAGYRMISLFGRQYLAHRVAWLYMTGSWPSGEIDHINRVRSDNSWNNLRDITHKQNIENVSKEKPCKKYSKLAGANWDKSTGSWKSCICVNGKHIHLGRFKTDSEAHEAYVSAKRSLHKGSTL